MPFLPAGRAEPDPPNVAKRGELRQMTQTIVLRQDG